MSRRPAAGTVTRPDAHRPERPLDGYPAADLPPLPPAGAPGAPDGSPAAATDGPARPAPAVALLRFLDPGAMGRTITLEHPFALDDGREVRAIEIRRLNVAEVGAVMLGYGDDDPMDVYDFIAAMTGLAPAVLRGLAADDGAAVLEAARPLLPRFAQGLLGQAAEPQTTAEPEMAGASTGAATPSPPPGA